MDEAIKFTMDTSDTQIPFLVVLIKAEINKFNANITDIETDIYHKPTDNFNYFPFNSCAPNHIARNIPYNLARRIAKIVSSKKTRNLRLQELKPRLLKKKYPLKLILDSIKGAEKLDRAKLLKKKQSDNTKISDDKITLVLEHNPLIEDPTAKIRCICSDLVHTDKI